MRKTLLQTILAAFCAILCALSGMGGGGMIIGARTGCWAQADDGNLWVWPTSVQRVLGGRYDPMNLSSGVLYAGFAANGYRRDMLNWCSYVVGWSITVKANGWYGVGPAITLKANAKYNLSFTSDNPGDTYIALLQFNGPANEAVYATGARVGPNKLTTTITTGERTLWVICFMAGTGTVTITDIRLEETE